MPDPAEVLRNDARLEVTQLREPIEHVRTLDRAPIFRRYRRGESPYAVMTARVLEAKPYLEHVCSEVL